MNTEEICEKAGLPFRGSYGMVQSTDISVPFKLTRCTGSDVLVILLNGAVDRKRANGYVFQRSTWAPEIKANVLNIADPTISPENSLGIGWGQSGQGAALDSMLNAVSLIANTLGIEPRRKIYYGSSAGGFQALQLGARDPRAHVIVNNPQTDWTHYQPSSVEALSKVVYPNMDIDMIRKQFSANCSVISAMEMRKSVPNVDYYVNVASPSDLNNHLRRLVNSLRKSKVVDQSNKFSFHYYSDEKAGHNPLSKDRTLDILNERISTLG